MVIQQNFFSEEELISEEDVNDQLRNIAELARVLLDRHEDPSKGSKGKPLIVTLVGAGASMSAGLPSGDKLKKQIYRKLVPDRDENEENEKSFSSSIDFTKEVLDKEAHLRFPGKLGDGEDIQSLTLFEFASVVSQFDSGSEAIHKVVNAEIRQKQRHRPLAYELLAHLAKHGFVDHFISVNFDELLDHALEDEVPDRLVVIRSSDEIPGPRFLQRKLDARPIFLFKPFGSLSRDSYRLTPEETKQYGSHSVWNFIVNDVLRNKEDVYLLVVGYDAAEPAFRDFVTQLRNDDREVTVYVINPKESKELSESLQELRWDLESNKFRHIRLTANLAFDLLLQVMEREYSTNSKHNVWQPIDRHKALSYCLDYCLNGNSAEQKSDRRQFVMELILQAVKSRGFFNTEAIARVSRLKNYDQHAAAVIKDMEADGILQPYGSRSQDRFFDDKSRPFADENYQLAKHADEDHGFAQDLTDEELARYVLGKVSDRDPAEHIPEWTVDKQGSDWKATRAFPTRQDFLAKRFEAIRVAPELEIDRDADPTTRWLFRNPKVLRSFPELNEKAMKMFDEAFDETEGEIKFYGIWATGEWLFHEEGWAWETIGQKVRNRLHEGSLEMHMIIVKPPQSGTSTTFTDVIEQVRKNVEPFRKTERCILSWLSWVFHNHSLTFLEWPVGDKFKKAAIYIRRRHSTPVVTPVYVEGEDCEVLDRLFKFYSNSSERARPVMDITHKYQ